jgi:hypothetical protein
MEGLNQKILIKFATRSRPQKFASCIANILNNANQPDNLLILVSIDGDDIPMQNIREGSPIIHNIHFVSGSSKNKIDAINRDVNECQYDWDILINFSDDQEFVIKGFDDIIRKDFAEHFPSGDGCIHYKDKNAALMTMSIIDRKYYARFNYIYHSDYVSLWCDNEAQDVAIMLGRYKYIDNVIFHHNHPGWGLGAMDEQYRRTEAFYHQDEQTYLRRKENIFNLINIDGQWQVKA